MQRGIHVFPRRINLNDSALKLPKGTSWLVAIIRFFIYNRKQEGANDHETIVFKDKILKYQVGNRKEKDCVCDECRKMGIADDQMQWPE